MHADSATQPQNIPVKNLVLDRTTSSQIGLKLPVFKTNNADYTVRQCQHFYGRPM